MSLCVIKSEIYLFGGSGPSGTCFNDLQAFNPSKNEIIYFYNKFCELVKKQWTEIEMSNNSQIKPRAGHSTTVYEDKLFIMGGSYGQQYYKDFYILDTG